MDQQRGRTADPLIEGRPTEPQSPQHVLFSLFFPPFLFGLHSALSPVLPEEVTLLKTALEY